MGYNSHEDLRDLSRSFNSEIFHPMNILMVGLDLNPPWVEGIRNTVHELSLHLLKRGHTIHYLTKGYKDHKKCETIDGITYHRILTKQSKGYIGGSHQFFSYFPKIAIKVIREQKIDVVHGHSVYPFFGTYLGLCLLPTNLRKVFSQYSSIGKPPAFEYPKILRYGLRIAKDPFLLKVGLLDKVIVTSQRAYNEFIKKGVPPSKLCYLPIGIDVNEFNPNLKGDNIRKEFNITDEEKVILFAGDLTPYKGAEILIQALKFVADQNFKVKLIILTKGTYEFEEQRKRRILSLIKSLRLQDKVILLGVREDIKCVFAASDIVVLPFLPSYALMDIPRVLLEAMASGKPVIASNVGGISEIIKHKKNGLIINGGNVEELVEAIKILLNDEELSRKLGRNGRALVEAKFAWDNIVNRIEKIYGLS
jgi:glycosyltransferase involved in cell wall biosynthesis